MADHLTPEQAQAIADEIARVAKLAAADSKPCSTAEGNRRFDAAKRIGWRLLSDVAEDLGIVPRWVHVPRVGMIEAHPHSWTKFGRELTWQHSDDAQTAGVHELARADWARLLEAALRSSAGEAKVAAGELMDSADLARLLGVASSTLRVMRAQPARHRKLDGLPAPIRTVSGAPVWDRAQVVAWWQGRRYE